MWVRRNNAWIRKRFVSVCILSLYAFNDVSRPVRWRNRIECNSDAFIYLHTTSLISSTICVYLQVYLDIEPLVQRLGHVNQGLVDGPVVDTEDLGGLGTLEYVDLRVDLLSLGRISFGNVISVWESLVQCLTINLQPRKRLRRTYDDVIIRRDRSCGGDESLTTGFLDGQSFDVGESDYLSDLYLI